MTKLLDTSYSLLGDLYDKITAEQSKAMDKMLFEEMKEESKITLPVLICSRKTKFTIEDMLPGMFCILGTDLCDDDKCYMVTDSTLANNIRQNLGYMGDENK